MDSLQVFKNEQFGEVRVMEHNGEPWFVGKDVAGVLRYQNGSRDINRHVDDEDRQNYQNGTFESPRGMTIINESGLYSLILSSKLPTQRSMDLGLFEVKETTITHADGHISVSKTPKVTGKGQVYFVKKFVGGDRDAC